MVSLKNSHFLPFFIFLKKSEKIFGPLGHFLFLTHFEAKCVKIKKNFSKTAKKSIYKMRDPKNTKKPWTFLTHFDAKCVKIFCHLFLSRWHDIPGYTIFKPYIDECRFAP